MCGASLSRDREREELLTIAITEFKSGSRRGKILDVRAKVSNKLMADLQKDSEVAQQVGVSGLQLSKSLG